MNDSQRQERERAYAKVIFKQGNLPGYVRDISKKGCKIDLLTEVAWEIHDKKKIVIIPEEEVGFAPVHGTVEIRWISQTDLYYSIGVQLVSVQDADSKENYINLLNYFESKKK